MPCFSNLNQICDQKSLVAGKYFSEHYKVSPQSKERSPDGNLVLKAKTEDGFCVVNHVRITVNPRDHQIVDYRCDCDGARTGFCKHCAAFVFSIDETVNDLVPQRCACGMAPDTEADAQAKPAAEPSSLTPVTELEFCPPGIQVQFGSLADSDDPVIWCPNDTAQLFHPNMGIIGTMGTGKTQFTKSIVTQLIREKKRNFGGGKFGILIFDYKGDYNETKRDFVNAAGARVLKPYHLPYNPFALIEGRTFKPLLPRHTSAQFVESVSKLMYQLGPKQEEFLLDCIMQAYRAQGIDSAKPSTWIRKAPTFNQVWSIFNQSAKNMGVLTTAMKTLRDFEIFDSTPQSINSLLDGVVVMDLSGYAESIQNFIVSITLDQIYLQMQSWGSSATDGRYRQLRQLVLVDEADNFMRMRIESLRKIMKEGREYGVGTVLSTQSLKHFVDGSDDDYSRYILTWVVHATGDLKQSDAENIFKLPPKDRTGAEVYSAIKKLDKHESVAKISNEAPIRMRDKAFWQLMQENETK